MATSGLGRAVPAGTLDWELPDETAMVLAAPAAIVKLELVLVAAAVPPLPEVSALLAVNV